MAFDVFRNQAKSYAQRASINPHGHIGLSVGAVHAFNLRQKNLVLLLYDKEDQRIGIKPIDNAEMGSVRLRKTASGVGLSARNFLNYHRIMPSKTTIFPIQEICDNTYGVLLTIALGQGTVRGRKRSSPPPLPPELAGATPLVPKPPPAPATTRDSGKGIADIEF